jgi:hypothetical protein
MSLPLRPPYAPMEVRVVNHSEAQLLRQLATGFQGEEKPNVSRDREGFPLPRWAAWERGHSS